MTNLGIHGRTRRKRFEVTRRQKPFILACIRETIHITTYNEYMYEDYRERDKSHFIVVRMEAI